MYYIYHIKNRKIGCSNNPDKRAKSQLKKNETYEIIYQTEDIKMASLIEQTAQMMYGYRVDVMPYSHSVEQQRLRGLKGAQTMKEKGQSEEAKKQMSKAKMGNKSLTGRKWVQKDGKGKALMPDQIQKYLNEGWTYGKPYNKQKTKE